MVAPKPFLFDHAMGPQAFSRAGTPAFLDPCRRILVHATPEERVRQQLLAYLWEHLGVPQHLVKTEVHLMHLAAASGVRGRVDVVVHTPDRKPLMLFECKAPHVSLGDDALDQALRYHRAIGGTARLIATTNGLETRWYSISAEGLAQRIVHAPRFTEMFAGVLPGALLPKALPPRPHPRAPTAAALRWLVEKGAVGEGSPLPNQRRHANLAGLFLLETETPALRGRAPVFEVQRSGIRSTSFGNASGGQWSGRYRYFVIKDARGDAQIISMSVLGMMLVRNHPRFGNTSGHTMLIVAIDDFDKRHNSLQLDLDRFVDVSDDRMTIWHDGTLTRGKRGAAPRAEVLAYTRKRAPHLVDGSRVLLGKLPLHTLVTWQDADDFTCNLIEYALVRDAYRREAT